MAAHRQPHEAPMPQTLTTGMVLPLVYAVASVVCFLAYAFDKAAARAGRWRTSENTLLLLGLAGGWPGGLLAQQLLRHKTAKPSFLVAFWATVVVNVVGLLVLTTPIAQMLWRN